MSESSLTSSASTASAVPNPFAGAKPAAPLSAVERWVRKSRPDLAEAALRHALGQTDLMVATDSLVRAALSPYALDDAAEHRVRVAVWRSAVEALVRSGRYDASARDLLMRLRRPLNIGEDDALAVERDLVVPLYTARVRAAAEGPVEQFDRTALLREAAALNIPADAAAQLVRAAGEDLFKRLCDSLAFQTNANGVVIRRAMPAAEVARVRSAAEALGVTLTESQERRLENETRVEEMMSGRFTAVRVPINLGRGEHCMLATECTWREPRSTRYGEELITVDTGTLYITSERVVFNGHVKTTALKYQNLLDIELFVDGFRCRKATGKSPLFQIPDDSAYIACLLAHLIFNQAREGHPISAMIEGPAPDESRRPNAPRAPSAQGSGTAPPPGARDAAVPEAGVPTSASHRAASGVDEARLEKAMSELNRLTGLAPVKQEVTSLVNLAKVRAMRAAQGLPVPPMAFHLVFTGRPGTGKTTVARILGDVFAALGTLPKGQLVETDRAGLVGGYVGQTALKTTDVLQSALGGILFIDEAYALAGRGENDFGTEAIETLLKSMEDHRAELIVIVAGYKTEMDTFLNANPGLRSRFTRYIDFPDYSASELLAIFAAMVSAEGFELSSEAHANAEKLFAIATLTAGATFGNARLARNVFERAVTAQANRLADLHSPTRAELCLLTGEDIPNSQDVS